MVEPDEHMAVAYVPNQMREPAQDTRGMEVVMAAYDGLQGLRAGSGRARSEPPG